MNALSGPEILSPLQNSLISELQLCLSVMLPDTICY
nr:MAG TPA: hypothetical protein [Caudoviricetes sp.]